MANITVKQFQGYSSKADKTWENPALLSLAENCIINKGDLCNFPFPLKAFRAAPFEQTHENLMFIHYFYKSSAVPGDTGIVPIMAMFSRKGKLYVSSHGIFAEDVNGNPLTSAFTNFVEVSLDPVMLLPEVMYPQWPLINFDPNPESNEINALAANTIQVGDWTVLLAPFNFVSESSESLPYTPQMVRFRGLEYVSSPNILYTLEPHLLGIKQPIRISYDSVSAGYVTGRYDFGFSFVTSYDGSGSDTSTPPVHTHGLHDIESNVTILNNEQTYENHSILFKIYLPANWSSPGGTGIRALKLGIYARASNESIYYFIGYSGSLETHQISTDANGNYILFQYSGYSGFSDLTTLQDPLRNAPLTDVTPIPDAHDVPQPARHAAYFKNRMYYAPVGYPHNLMQCSALPRSGEKDTGKNINYIERQQFVGKAEEKITGFIEFLGQLLILKEDHIFVLPDDISVVAPRLLFSNIGCVNSKGGQAYIVIKDTLYFGSKKGIYSYDGSTLVCISELIREDLESISAIRYSFMRLRHLPRENILMVCFPIGLNSPTDEYPKTFLYNYEEKAWTSRDGFESDVIEDKTRTQKRSHALNILLLTRNDFTLLGLLTDDLDPVGAYEPPYTPHFATSLLTLGDSERFKHWKFCKFYTVTRMSDGAINFLWPAFLNEKNNLIGASYPTDGTLNLKRIGGFSRQLSIEITAYAGYEDKSFRINGYEVEAHLKGRR